MDGREGYGIFSGRGGDWDAIEVASRWNAGLHTAFLVAFADDPQHAVGTVDGGDLESGGLADAQAAGVGQREAGLVDGIADWSQQLANLAIRQRGRQPLLTRLANLFLENSGQSRFSV
jgi:hypothetical protein